MKSKILSDVTLNIFAALVPMFVLQFFILPKVATDINSKEYGQLIALVALMNLCAGTFGNTLNNSRLLNYKKYSDINVQGDYSILLRISILANILFMVLGLWYYGRDLNIFSGLLLILASIFLLVRSYANVEFRTKLNFKNILVDSLVLFVGYLAGFFLFMTFGYWQLIYICGFAASFIFVLNKTNTLKEPLIKTSLFKQTTSQTITLMISGLLLSLAIYIDKLLLYPLLGGAAVTVYYTATILGKTISLVIQPITSVMLSYFAQLNKFEAKNFRLLFGVSTIIGVVVYGLTIVISAPLLRIIYPQYVNDAVNYIYVTTFSIIVTIISDILNSVLLKFCPLGWQLVINGTFILVYIVATLTLLNIYGLMGFCIGILMASLVKLISVIAVYYLNNKNFKPQVIKKKGIENGNLN